MPEIQEYLLGDAKDCGEVMFELSLERRVEICCKKGAIYKAEGTGMSHEVLGTFGEIVRKCV